jgi:response regulator RpfG family c-di-GMP phosphodiesterase
MKEKILCVDDDSNILAAYQRNLRKEFDLDAALGGEEALKLMATRGPYAVLVAGMQMPVMNGIEFLTRAMQQAPDSVRIMLTGNADQRTAVDAVNQGHIFRFLTKPCPPEILALALTAGVRQYRLITAERDLLERTLNGSVKVLTDILSLQDPQIFSRSQLLRSHLRTFLNASQASQTWHFEMAAMLAQVGLVTIPALVVQKARSGKNLTSAEREMMAMVPEMGANLLANIPRLEPVAEIVRFQHKLYDGTGHPLGAVSGEQIPIGARILKVLTDLIELEVSGMPRGQALLAMQKRAGWYDPRVLDATFSSFDVYLPQPTPDQQPSRPVMAQNLQPGQVLVSDIVTVDGMLIFAAGNQITPTLLMKIRNFAALNGIKEPILVEA